jgi:hypothetical protein
MLTITMEDPDERQPGDPEPKRQAVAVLRSAEFFRGLGAAPEVVESLMLRALPEGEQPDERVMVKGTSEPAEKVGEDTGRMKFVISSDREDRQGDVLSVDGWEFANYEKNPIVLFDHDYGEVGGSPPSQGTTASLTMKRKDNEGVRRVIAEMEFHRKFRFNEELYSMYRGGFMRTTSVGFWPLEMPATRESSRGGMGFTFGKKELLEWSLVAVPANADAYQLALKKGIVRRRTVEYLASLLVPFAEPSRPGAGEQAQKAAQGEQDAASAATASLLAARMRNLNRRL